MSVQQAIGTSKENLKASKEDVNISISEKLSASAVLTAEYFGFSDWKLTGTDPCGFGWASRFWQIHSGW